MRWSRHGRWIAVLATLGLLSSLISHVFAFWVLSNADANWVQLDIAPLQMGVDAFAGSVDGKRYGGLAAALMLLGSVLLWASFIRLGLAVQRATGFGRHLDGAFRGIALALLVFLISRVLAAAVLFLAREQLAPGMGVNIAEGMLLPWVLAVCVAWMVAKLLAEASRVDAENRSFV